MKYKEQPKRKENNISQHRRKSNKTKKKQNTMTLNKTK